MGAPAVVRASPRQVEPNFGTITEGAKWRVLSAILLVSALGLWWMLGSQTQRLWDLWTTNPLSSIGILVPAVVVVLTVRAWRGRNWERCGTWWGLPVCATGLLLACLDKAHQVPFVAHRTMVLHVFPVGLQVFLYVTGAVLLFAGPRYYRAALFPICLLLFLNPAPPFFTNMVDLPLQYAGAHAARSFAGWVGVSLSADDLRIMFSPTLGMMIAPGCNGIRGALTMGLLTAVLGHVYGLPWLLRGAYIASGVAFAYVLNLVRLCGLVLCYRVALDYAPLARHMSAADYVLGSILFFSAAIFVLALPRKWKQVKQSAS